MTPRAGAGALGGGGALLRFAAEETGLAIDEIQSECQPGKSLATIIEAAGGSVDAYSGILGTGHEIPQITGGRSNTARRLQE